MATKAEKYIDADGMRWWAALEIQKEHGIQKATAAQWCALGVEWIDGTKRLADSWVMAKLATRMPDGRFSRVAKLTDQQVSAIARLLLMGALVSEVMEAADVSHGVAQTVAKRPDVRAAIAAILNPEDTAGWISVATKPEWLSAAQIGAPPPCLVMPRQARKKIKARIIDGAIHIRRAA